MTIAVADQIPGDALDAIRSAFEAVDQATDATTMASTTPKSPSKCTGSRGVRYRRASCHVDHASSAAVSGKPGKASAS